LWFWDDTWTLFRLAMPLEHHVGLETKFYIV
jgi:hypothetical protein